MRNTKRALGSALAAFAAIASALALAQSAFAQSNGVARDTTWPVAGAPAIAGTLAPPEIAAEVRRAGFEPLSRPVQRGRVYVLLALDPYDMDVKLTVDAGSGRVLWVADAIGARYGGARYFSNRPLSRYDSAPIPPGNIPNIGLGKNNSGSARTSASIRPSAPLPRTRPADLTSASAKETAPLPLPRAAEGRGEPKAAAPSPPDVAPAAKAPPVTMVPVAPLE